MMIKYRLLLKFKQIIISKDEKHLILDNLSKRVDNYKRSIYKYER